MRVLRTFRFAYLYRGQSRSRFDVLADGHAGLSLASGLAQTFREGEEGYVTY